MSGALVPVQQSAWRQLPGVPSRPSLKADIMTTSVCALFIGAIPGLPLLLLWLWRRARRASIAAREAGENDDVDRLRRESWKAWSLFFAALVAYVFLICVPVKRRPWIMQTYPFRSFLEFFSVRYTYEGDPLPADKQYLFAMAPHGLYPFQGALTPIGSFPSVWGNVRYAVASAALWVPSLRQLMGWVGCISVDRSSIVKTLRAGESLCLLPGGIAEMARTEADRERLVIMSRKGIVKLALEHGVPIVPVYVLGVSTLWNNIPLPAFVEKLSRALAISIVLPYGRFGFLLPRKQRLLYAIGNPIVGTGAADDAAVNAAHAALVEGLRRLYLTHRSAYGWPNRELLIE